MVSTLWEFDFQARIWTQKADFQEYPDPDEFTTGVAGFSLGDKGYMWVARAYTTTRTFY